MKQKTIYCITLFFLFFSAVHAQEIDVNRLISDIKYLSSDKLQGRKITTQGNKMAREFIAERFADTKMEPLNSQDFHQPYEYPISQNYLKRLYGENTPENASTISGGNVVGVVKGKSSKYIVVTAHLDHLGVKGEEIYNGADDNASGAAALLTIAEYFSKKQKPFHNIIIAAVDGEEMGMSGSKYLVENFSFDSKDIALNINLDMIAHNDSNEIYVSGTHHYPYLKPPLNNIQSEVNILFGHDNPSVKKLADWTFSSDHASFHKKNIPWIYFGVEDHEDYHKPTDTFDKINQPFYVEAVKLIIKAIEAFDTALQDL